MATQQIPPRLGVTLYFTQAFTEKNCKRQQRCCKVVRGLGETQKRGYKPQDTTSPGKKTGFCASRTTKHWVWFRKQEPKCTRGLLAIEGASAPSLGAAHGGTDHPMLILCRRPQPNLALETTVLHQILQLNWRRPDLVICHHHVPVPHGSAVHMGPSSSFSLSWCFSRV